MKFLIGIFHKRYKIFKVSENKHLTKDNKLPNFKEFNIKILLGPEFLSRQEQSVHLPSTNPAKVDRLFVWRVY